MRSTRIKLFGIFMALALAASTAASAQLNSNAGTITLNATLPESLTVSVTSGAIVNFTLAANTASNAGSTTSTVQTAWTLAPGRTKVAVWAWVANGASALSDGAGDNIAASAVTATASGSGSAGGKLNATPSGGAAPSFITGAGTGVQIGSVAITGTNKTSSTTTTLTWNIDTTPTPQLPAGTYTGVVNIQAQATP